EVEHRVEELRLPGDVRVERHGPDAEVVGHAAHRDGAQPVRVGELDGGPDDAIRTEAPGGRGLGTRPPEQDQTARGVTRAAVLSGHLRNVTSPICLHTVYGEGFPGRVFVSLHRTRC